MAAANAGMETLATTIKDLVSERQRPPQITAVPVREKTADPMETVNAMVTLAREIAPKSVDPMETVNAVVALAKEMAPKQDGSNSALIREVLEANRLQSNDRQAMNDRITAMQDKQIDDLRAELRASRRESEAANVPPKSFADQLKELKEFSATIKEISGVVPDDEPKRGGGFWGAVLEQAPVIIPGVLGLFQTAANMMYNHALANAGAGKPQPPPNVQTEQQPPMMMAGIAPPAPQEDPNMMNPLYAVFSRFHPFLQQVEKPLIDFLFDPQREHAGADFAEIIITIKGRPDYEQLKGAGPETILNLLKSYPPIWNQVQSLPASIPGVPDKVAAFISDFMDYDSIREAEETGADEPPDSGVKRVVVATRVEKP